MTQLARDIEAGRSASTGIEWDAENEAKLDDGTKVPHPIIWCHGLSPTPGAPKKTALLMLDADADLDVNRQAFGADLRSINIPAVRQTYVIQVTE